MCGPEVMVRSFPDKRLTLDPTCSFRNWWSEEDVSGVVFTDNRGEVHPDVLCDAGCLPFRDEFFEEIRCDPPHMIQKNYWKSKDSSIGSSYFYRYGNFNNRKEWLSFLHEINQEFHRALKCEGKLLLKITVGRDRRLPKLEDLKLLSNFEELGREEKRSRSISPDNRVYYLRYRKKGMDSIQGE